MPMLRCSSANMGEENEKRCIFRRGISHFLLKSHHPSASQTAACVCLKVRMWRLLEWYQWGIEVYIGAYIGRKRGHPLGRIWGKEGLNLGEPPRAYISPTCSPLSVAPLFSHFWKWWRWRSQRASVWLWSSLGTKGMESQRDYLYLCGAAGFHGHSGWQL